jgi:phage-related protein
MAAEEKHAEADPKPLFWVGSSQEDLREFPKAVRGMMGFALRQAQNGGKHLDAKPLRGFGGAGVLEVVADEAGSTYRASYTVKFARAVYVLHAFQKKSRKRSKTPRHEVDLIRQRLKAAEADYKNRRASGRGERGKEDEGDKGRQREKK